MNGIVLIPAYKPDAKMTGLVRELYLRGMTVVLVDDGSGEDYRGSFDAAEAFAYVVRCDKNGGKGEAIKTGLRFIRERFEPPYTVVTADADGQHRPKDILRVMKAAKKRPDSLAIGYRTISREMPLRNWFGNFYTKIAFLFATGKGVRDTQTGLRGFSDKTVPFLLDVRGSRYEYEMNVLLHWARCNRQIFGVPIRTIYHDGNSTSHFKAVRDSIIIYGEIIKFSAQPFFCYLFDLALFLSAAAILPFSPALFLANAIARPLSSTLFWVLRRRSVRKHFPDTDLSLPRCAAFSAADYVLNTLLIWFLSLPGMPLLWAKVLADVALYFITFIPIRKYFYRSRKNPDPDPGEEKT